MLRSAASKVMWVGRATVFLMGLAVILAVVFGATSTALGADGDFFQVGRNNLADSVSKLTKSGTGPALDLRVDSGPPLRVNPDRRVINLNADKLDGKDASEIVEEAKPLAASINADGTLARSNRTGEISSVKLSGAPGNYKVTFPIDVSSCMPVATVGNQTGSTSVTDAVIETARGDIVQSVFVDTATPGGSPVDMPFAIAVIC
jgi:hypothetical protein